MTKNYDSHAFGNPPPPACHLPRVALAWTVYLEFLWSLVRLSCIASSLVPMPPKEKLSGYLVKLFFPLT